MKSATVYSLGYLGCLFLVGFVFEKIFPHNLAYASLASWMAGFIFAAYFVPNIQKIALSYVIYFSVALISSVFDLGWLGSHDTAGSIFFPALAAVVFVSPLIATLVVIAIVSKVRVHFKKD
ncbi:MAG: hypothetical protein AABY83_14535 [Pseudomonadota bacterium]